MIKKLKISLLVSLALVLSAGFFVTRFSLAEEVENQVLMMEGQMSQLIEAQLQLTQAIEGMFPENGGGDYMPQPQAAGGDGTLFPPPGNCISAKQEWSSSNTYSDSDWSTQSKYTGSSRINQYLDINGDGLPDHLDYKNDSSLILSCIHLNTGSGWELAHKCWGQKVNNVWTFYGDCAEV